MSAWEEYKKKLGTTRPWDILSANSERATDELANDRLKTCENCDSLIKLTKQCKECGCFMVLKVKLKQATCPLGKW